MRKREGYGVRVFILFFLYDSHLESRCSLSLSRCVLSISVTHKAFWLPAFEWISSPAPKHMCCLTPESYEVRNRRRRWHRKEWEEQLSWEWKKFPFTYPLYYPHTTMYLTYNTEVAPPIISHFPISIFIVSKTLMQQNTLLNTQSFIIIHLWLWNHKNFCFIFFLLIATDSTYYNLLFFYPLYPDTIWILHGSHVNVKESSEIRRSQEERIMKLYTVRKATKILV